MTTESADARPLRISQENLDHDELRREQISHLGYQLLDALRPMSADQDNPAMRHEALLESKARLDDSIQKYVAGHEVPKQGENEYLHIESDEQIAFRILRVYLDDEQRNLDIPTDVVRISPESSPDKIRMNVAETIRRRQADPSYRPLLFVGYRKKGFEMHPKEVKPAGVLDLGDCDALFYNQRWPAMRQFSGIKAHSIIVDCDTTDRMHDNTHEMGLDCDVLGITTQGRVGSYDLKVRHALVQTGGYLLSHGGGLNVENITQTGGVNNAPRIFVGNYLHKGGRVNTSDIIVNNSYVLGKDAHLAARHTWISENATFKSEGGEIASPPQKGAPAEYEGSIDDMYRMFGEALIPYFFPHDTEPWSEMQVLFRTWYEDFKKTHQIPLDFHNAYPDTFIDQYESGWLGVDSGAYTYIFRYITNLVAFFYLNRLASIPQNKYVDVQQFDGFMPAFLEAAKEANGTDILAFLMHWKSQDKPSHFTRGNDINLREATVYKVGTEVNTGFMQHIRSVTAETVIIASEADYDPFSKKDKKQTFDITCNNLGVMVNGEILPGTKVVCNESVLQYGNIGDIEKLAATGEEVIKIHIHEAGINRAKNEICERYEQRGGLMHVGRLYAKTYEMQDGVAANSHIIGEKVTIIGGILQNVTIDADMVSIADGVQIEGNVVIKYRGEEPTIGNNILRKGSLQLQRVG